MSASNSTADPSTANLTAIFEVASNEYRSLTGQNLGTHPLVTELERNNSPESILGAFRKQAQALDKFRKGDDKLMKSLTPIVHVIFTLSATLGAGICLPFSPATVLFTGISVLFGVVKDVIASYKTLVNLFERTQFFLQRLNQYTAAPLTLEMTELLAKILAQVLSVLAFSTKKMKEGRIKNFMKRIVGKTDVEDALQRLNMLTREENLMMAVRTLGVTHDIRDDVDVIKEDTRNINDNLKETKLAMDELQWNQSREKLRTWLTPPNPSINHNIARDTQLDGTAKWFIQGSAFDEWKKNGSLLWIRGNPGSGKSVLSSVIIEDFKHMQESRLALVAYYYFDFKDVAKRDIRGLLTSLLLQLVDDSDRCRDLLSQLHKKCRDASEQPSEAMLAQCLKSMLDLPGQVPTYLVVDALDECPNNTGTPSAREKVLNFIEDLVQSKHSNLFICITSRPEQDINTVLAPLTSPSRRVSLHDEVGQREDINNYVHSFVQHDRVMRRWRVEDKELVISVLSERAHGMFRWVYCQLDDLRRCTPSSIRKTLDELPITLDDTYERILLGIPKQKRQHACRLFQSMFAAIRPLRVEELAEVFAIEFDSDAVLNLVEDWRPENPEEAVLSACSTLISVVIDEIGTKIVQFSHFSVKEFLTSDRLRTSVVGNISQYYIALEPAHTFLARTCLAVLLQLDENVDEEQLATFPLALYAAQHWNDHAKFENVTSRIQDAMECLFNPMKPHFQAWLWIYDMDARSWESVDGYDSSHELTPLYYAALCGFSGLAKHLIITHAEDVNAECRDYRTPLHAASHEGHVDVARVLLDHGADVDAPDIDDWTPLHLASNNGHPKVVELLLEHEATLDARSNMEFTPLYLASDSGHLEVVQLLLEHGADVNCQHIADGTPLQAAIDSGYYDIARLLLDHGASQILSRINQYNILRVDVVFWLLVFNWIYVIWIHDVISRYQRSMENIGE